jgi:DNA repair protein RadC
MSKLFAPGFGRQAAHQSTGDRPSTALALDTPQEVFELMRPHFRDQTREHVCALFLDDEGRPCSMSIWSGERDFIDLPLRRIIASGLAVDAAAMILAHNHPSGDSDPGPEDLRATRDLARIGSALNMRLVDHIIVAGDSLTSMRTLKLI